MSTSTTEETPDYKKIAELIAPEKHLCIKCKQCVARIGIVCDDCLAPTIIIIKEEKYMADNKENNKEFPIPTNPSTTVPSPTIQDNNS